MENINPYVLISKKMREINMSESPKTSLNSIPPQSANKNIFSDWEIENLISNRPIRKFNKESKKPIAIDFKIIHEITESE
jgi:hypothetical protein